jgi:FixJ family two-component response regulator
MTRRKPPRTVQVAEYRERIEADDRVARIVAEALGVSCPVVLHVRVPQLLARGLNAEQVAWRLGVSMRTVDRYKAHGRVVGA